MNLMSSIPSAFWASSSLGVNVLTRFISTIILTRLLFPEAFGAMLIIGAITSLITLLTDVGLRGSIINNARSDSDENYINTIWTLTILRGVSIAIIIFLASFFVEKIYTDIDSLSYYLGLTSLSALITGFQSTRMSQMERHMEMMRPAILQILVRIVALISTIGIASIYPTPISIILGDIVSVSISVILSHTFLIGTKNRIHIDKESLPGIFRYGRWIFFSTLLTWCVREGHKFFLGMVISVQILGFYAIGTNIANLSKDILTKFSDRWVFPMYVQLGEKGSLDISALKIRALIVLMGSFVVVILAVFSTLIVDILYEDRYAHVAQFITIIAIGSIGSIVTDCYVPIYKAKADSFGLMKNRMMQAGVLAVVVYSGYMYKGAEGIVLGSSLAQLIAGPATAFMARRHFGRKIFLLDSLLYTIPSVAFFVYHIEALSVVFQHG